MPSLTDSIGRVLGDRYRLVTAVGTGASAHVYLADDVSLKRQVAIKILHPALAGDLAFLKRFRAEARAVAALNHPNILQVYDWGEENGEPYLVLEYLAGGSLRQIYDTGDLLTPEQAVQIGIEASAGLDYAHRRGLVHRRGADKGVVSAEADEPLAAGERVVFVTPLTVLEELLRKAVG